jgi:hypothetical protein
MHRQDGAQALAALDRLFGLASSLIDINVEIRFSAINKNRLGVIVGTNTYSPRFRPMASNARCNAAVALLSAMACLAPT